MQNGEVEILSNDKGNRITPSYVAITEKGRLVGDAARDQAAANPLNTIFNIKWAEVYYGSENWLFRLLI